jgi:glycosyltransferase involved in cell wall biosynthesis
MVRVAINAWFLDQFTTGSGQYLNALKEWLPRVGTGHEFVQVLPARHAPAARGAGFVTARTPFDRVGENLAKLWFEQVSFPAACRRLTADVGFIPYWAAPWWQPCPMVVTVHDLIPLLLPAYRGGPLQRAYTALVSRTTRRAAAVLADSESSKRDVVQRLGIAAEKVHAVYLAADPRYQPVSDSSELARVRARYGLPAGPFLLYLGGFDVRKNLPRTVAAYAQLVARLHEHAPPLVIAGRPPASDSAFAPDPRPLISRLAIDDRVRLIGWVEESDKPALYSLATATVFASEYEGFGLPVLEAMGCTTVTH